MKNNSDTFATLAHDDDHCLRHHLSFFRATKNAQRGMTLLELIIVVALLSIVALAAVSLIVDTGEWKQQQVTEDQWLSVKRSIVGDNAVDANYRREYAGFATDMGRLPNCLRELIRPFDCQDDLSAANPLPLFAQDIDSNQWYGWRGPYLGVPGANEYRDGWRNKGRDDDTGNIDDLNYGWLFGTGAPNGTACQNAVVAQLQPGTIILQSCGDDSDVDNTEKGFPADFPYTEFDGAGNPIYVPLVTRHDYQVDLGASWINAPVKVKSATVGSSKIIAANDLRLRMNYPVANGRILDWTDALISTSVDRDIAPFLSATFPATASRLVDGVGKVYTGQDTNSDLITDGVTPEVVTFPPGSTLVDTTIETAAGVLTFSDGTVLGLQNCPCELEIDAGTLTAHPSSPPNQQLAGALWIAIKPENIAPMTADLGKYVIEVSQASIVNSPTSVTLPNGATLTFAEPADAAYFPKIILGTTTPTVTVSESFSINGDLVETDASADQFLVPSTSTPVGNVINVAKAVPTIPKGLRNTTIVCEAGAVGFEGALFDGNCVDNATTYAPIARPYQLEVSPRSYIPVPDEIVWDIQ